MIRRHTIRDGRWHRVHSHLGCCDCGLVHRVEYRGVTIRGHHFLDARVSRDKKLTCEARATEFYPFLPRLARTPAELAQRFHAAYERLAPRFGYRTRRGTAVSWRRVPRKNKQLMIAVCREILGGGKDAL